MKELFEKCTWTVCGIGQKVLSKCVHAHQLAKDCKNVDKIFVGCKTFFFFFHCITVPNIHRKNIVMSLLLKIKAVDVNVTNSKSLFFCNVFHGCFGVHTCMNNNGLLVLFDVFECSFKKLAKNTILCESPFNLMVYFAGYTNYDKMNVLNKIDGVIWANFMIRVRLIAIDRSIKKYNYLTIYIRIFNTFN